MTSNPSKILNPRGAWGIAHAALLAGLLCPALTSAQVLRTVAPDAPRAAMLERDAPADNLLKKAQAALDRRDWKLAIDSLQRILDDTGGGSGLLRVSGGDENYIRYESPRRRALELLASMPPEGMAAYRVLHDGQAKVLLDRATEDGDVAALRGLVERYFLSSYGNQGAQLLAERFLDLGNPAAALDLLDRIETQTSQLSSAVSPARLAIQRAAAFLALGDAARAQAVLDALGSPSDAAEVKALGIMRDTLHQGWQARSDEVAAAEDMWSMAGGSVNRDGRMPAVAPELRANLPWRYALPSDYPDWWEDYWANDEESERAIPAMSAVVADGRIFVKNLHQVVALDLESLDELWATHPATPFASQFVPNRRSRLRLQNAPQPHSDRERLLYDHVGASLSVIDGRVFAIEREGAGESLVVRIDRRGRVSAPVTGTQLIALDAASGKVLWRRGRMADPDDPLGDVEFLSVPIHVSQELWVVYVKRGDLFLSALDPSRGTVRRSLLLCSLNARQWQKAQLDAVYPAFDGNTVYLATGAGLVLAVDVEPFALRWATQYPRIRREPGSPVPPSWTCNPVVPVGRLLLAAPPDCAGLLALDRGSGAIQWSRARPEGANYVLAADSKRVWLAGKRLFAWALGDGATLWEAPQEGTFETTGRSALSGGSIFVPTRRELVVIDAATGSALDALPLPEDQLPLGNLLCVASAAISVDTNEVRKFPDLTLSYPKALARRLANPRDQRAAIRLAWMEMLRGNPAEAYAVLQDVGPIASTRGAIRSQGDIARLRVDALLGMAKKMPLGDAQKISYLRDAVRLASSSRDRLRATLAMTDELRQLGERDGAYIALWKLGLTEAGDGYVTIESKLRNKARRVIAFVLARFERDLTARQLSNIARESRRVLGEALTQRGNPQTRRDGTETLRQLAELDDAGGGGQRATVELARAARQKSLFERSEQYYLEAIRGNRVAQVTAEAMLELAEQYVSPEQQLHASAARLLDRVQRDFAGTTLPSGARAGEVADALRKRLDPKRLAAGRFLAKPKHFSFRAAPAADIEANIEQNNHVLLTDGSPPGEAFTDRVLLYDASDTLFAIDSHDGGDVWSARLSLLGQSPSPLADGNASVLGPGVPRALGDGQTAIINGARGTFAVGMRTGRRLWGVPYEEPDTARAFTLRNRLVAVEAGRMIYAPRRGVLACASVRDGDDLLWERLLSGDRIDTVFLADDTCITIDNQRNVAAAYDADNGRFLSRISFKQPSLQIEPIPAAYVLGHLVVPNGPQTVACFNLRTGERYWEIPLEAPLRWIFKAGGGYVGICAKGGRVLLVDVLGNEIKLDVTVPEAADGYAEGIIRNETLLLMPIKKTGRGDEPALLSLDLDTGQARWKIDDLGVTGANRYALWSLLRLASETMPLFRRVEVESENTFTREMGEIVAEVVDKLTGERVGQRVSTGRSASLNERLTGDFLLRPGRLIVGTRKGVITLSIAEQD